MFALGVGGQIVGWDEIHEADGTEEGWEIKRGKCNWAEERGAELSGSRVCFM